MSDCAISIRNAVQTVYQDLGPHSPRHYWCLFHVFKAFKKNTKDYLTQNTAEALDDFRTVMYTRHDPCGHMQLFLAKWKQISAGFSKYTEKQWETNIRHWALAYRTVSHISHISITSYSTLTFYVSSHTAFRPTIKGSIQTTTPKLGTDYLKLATSQHPRDAGWTRWSIYLWTRQNLISEVIPQMSSGALKNSKQTSFNV